MVNMNMADKKSRIALKAACLSLIGLALTGCFKEEWEGFVYPNKNNLTYYQSIGVFSSLESCSDAAYGRLYQLNATTRGTYECGLNCEYNNDMGLKVCERTAR